ncbi:MAG: phosphoribosyl-ATP diphosphatase [Stellaceae bacterium]
MSDIDGTTLDRLFAVIATRRGADPATSYTAKLLREGKSAIAKKLGEEAIEAGIEVVKGDRLRLTAESADLLYHLLVAWADVGVAPADVWRALEARQGRSGIAEKQSRAGS